MIARVLVVLVAVLVACGARPPPPPTTGAIAGFVRDLDSGDPIAKAEIRLRAPGGDRVTTTNDDGLYDVDRVPPGTYRLRAEFAGQPIDVAGVVVRPGSVTPVDLTFTLGRPEPLHVDWGDLAAQQIRRYQPRGVGADVAIIEGTVTDSETQQRVPGAVVTAVAGGETLQTVCDDHGRFRFDGVVPGTYAVSAYYNVSGRGQIEVLRSGITVAAAEAVVVPLWVELAK